MENIYDYPLYYYFNFFVGLKFKKIKIKSWGNKDRAQECSTQLFIKFKSLWTKANKREETIHPKVKNDRSDQKTS